MILRNYSGAQLKVGFLVYYCTFCSLTFWHNVFFVQQQRFHYSKRMCLCAACSLSHPLQKSEYFNLFAPPPLFAPLSREIIH